MCQKYEGRGVIWVKSVDISEKCSASEKKTHTLIHKEYGSVLFSCSAYLSTLTMEELRFSETSVNLYQITRRYIAE
jgi:hypothetical protein